MDFLWNNPIVGGVVAIVGGGVIAVTIPFIVKQIFNSWKKKAIAKLEELLTCPEWKEIVQMIIDKIQKEMVTAKGEEKMQAVIKKLQALIPGSWDDEIIKTIVQTIYNEAKVKIELKK